MLDLDTLFPAAARPDHRTAVRRKLRGLGAAVKFTAAPAVPEFGAVLAEPPGSPTIDVARVTRLADGGHVVLVRDDDTALDAAVLVRLLITTGHGGRAVRDRAEHADGSTVTVLQLDVSIVSALGHVRRAVEVDKLDRPAGCRVCGGPAVRSYHPFAGGWVHSRCSTEPTDPNARVRRQLALSVAVVEHHREHARSAAERMDFAAVRRHEEFARFHSSESYLRSQIGHVLKHARRAHGRTAQLIGA